MASGRHLDLGRYLRHGVSLLGIVSLSVLSTLLVQHLLNPPPAGAQAGQAQEIRAAAFTVVDANGAVLGRLGPSDRGNGNLTLYDTAGKVRTELGGGGGLNLYDVTGQYRLNLGGGTAQIQPGLVVYAADGQTARLRLSISPTGNPSVTVWDTDGKTIRAGFGQNPSGAYGAAVFDPSGQIRVGLGQDPAGNYGAAVLDTSGQPVASLP